VTPAHPPASTQPCIGADPTCPCQDGDPCHYRDDPTNGTKAWPIPANTSQPGSTAGRLAGLNASLVEKYRQQIAAGLRIDSDAPEVLLAEHDRLTAELDEARDRAVQAEAAFVAAEDRGDRMRDEAQHWAERCAEAVDERESAEAALAEAIRVQRVQTGQVERVRAEHHDDGGWCDGCGYSWPCRTIRALAAPTDAGGGG